MAATTTEAASAAPPSSASQSAQPSGHDGAESQAPVGLGAAVQALWGDLRGALHERARLATLELRLAGLTLVQLVVCAVLVAVLGVTSWLGLMAALVAGLVAAGLHWAVGLAAAIVLNLAVAVWLVLSMRGLIARMDLQATLRRLQGQGPTGMGHDA